MPDDEVNKPAEGEEVAYPRMVYHKTKGHTVVKDAAHHKAHLEAGWVDDAPIPVAPAEGEDRIAALEARVDALEAAAEKRKK